MEDLLSWPQVPGAARLPDLMEGQPRPRRWAQEAQADERAPGRRSLARRPAIARVTRGRELASRDERASRPPRDPAGLGRGNPDWTRSTASPRRAQGAIRAAELVRR